MNEGHAWIACLSVFLSALIPAIYVRTQFKSLRVHRIWVLVWFVPYYAALLYGQLIHKTPYYYLIINLAFVYVFTLMYEGTTQKRLLSTVFTYLLLVLCEGAGVAIMGLFRESMTPYRYDLVKMILVKGLTLVLILIYQRTRENKISGNPVKVSTGLGLLLVPVLSFLAVCIFAFSLDENRWMVLTITTVLIVINVIVFILYEELKGYYDRQMKLQFIRDQSRYYAQYLKDVISHQDVIVRYQHDIKNKLLAIDSHVENGNADRARALIRELGAFRVTSTDFLQTGLVEIDSIVNDKLTRAARAKVQINYKAEIPKNPNMDANDLASIVGNLLDNALEAVEAVPEESRFIDLSIKYAQGVLTMVMENSFHKTREKKGGGRYSTTKTDKLLHGYGLDSIAHTAEKYNGSLVCSDANGVFTSEVILFEQ